MLRAENRIPRSTGWVLTYGDMVSLLVVFFVLFFALSQRRPQETERRSTPVVGYRNNFQEAPVSRHSSFPGWWTPVGHVKLRPPALAFHPEELRYLDEVLLPQVTASAMHVVLVGSSGKDPGKENGWQAAAKVRDYLVAGGVDPDRISTFATATERIFDALIARERTWADEVRVEIYLAPVVVASRTDG